MQPERLSLTPGRITPAGRGEEEYEGAPVLTSIGHASARHHAKLRQHAQPPRRWRASARDPHLVGKWAPTHPARTLRLVSPVVRDPATAETARVPRGVPWGVGDAMGLVMRAFPEALAASE